MSLNNALIAEMREDIRDEKVLLTELIRQSATREIAGGEYLERWENFQVQNQDPILKNRLMVDAPGMIRVFCAFALPAKLIMYLDGQAAYLNHGEELTAHNAYVFDIPMNAMDSLNVAVAFDDSQYSAITCKFLRFQVVR